MQDKGLLCVPDGASAASAECASPLLHIGSACFDTLYTALHAKCELNYEFLCNYYGTFSGMVPLFSTHKASPEQFRLIGVLLVPCMQAVLLTLSKRYGIFPAGTRMKVQRAPGLRDLEY